MKMIGIHEDDRAHFEGSTMLGERVQVMRSMMVGA